MTLALVVGLLALLFSGSAYAAPDQADSSVSYTALADMLQDSKARQALVDQLRELAAQQEAGPQKAPAETAQAPSKEPVDYPAQEWSLGEPLSGVAGVLQHFASSMAEDFTQTAGVLRHLFNGDGIPGLTGQQWRLRLLNLLLAVLSAVVAFVLFRQIAALFFRRLDAWVQRRLSSKRNPAQAAGRLRPGHQGVLLARIGAMLGAIVIDAIAIALAALATYAVVLYMQTQWNTPTTLVLIFLGAFVAVEFARSLCRAVFSERHPNLRLWNMEDAQARYWSAWLQRIISITGYGMLVVVPVMEQMVTESVGRLAGLFIMVAVYIYAVRVIWSNRHDVQRRFEGQAQAAHNAFFSTVYRVMGKVWHWLGLAYFTALLVVTQLDQADALPFMVHATVRTLIILGLATVLAAVLSSLLARPLRLSDDLRQRLPLLEARLNSYVPGMIRLMRAVVLLVALLLILDAWKAFSLSGWLYSPSGRAVIATLMHVALVVVIAMAVWTVLASIIENRLNESHPDNSARERQKTVLTLFRSALLVVIVTLTVLVILSQVGVDIAPLIAGAGVMGLAISFGAQKLVQDVITGVFIQLENGMNHNDIVEVAGIFGTVEKITIRSVGIRTMDGGYHLISFSAIDKVSNHTRDFGYHHGEYTISYGADVDEAIVQLRLAFDDLMQDTALAGAVLGEIEIPGVTSLHERGYNIRVLIKTIPGMQWAVQRGFNRVVRKRFSEAGIDLPYPQTVLHFAKQQPGDRDALPIRQVPEA